MATELNGADARATPNFSTKSLARFQLPNRYDRSGNRCFDEGAYSYVFFSNGVATKIFKRSHELSEDFIRRVFQSEVNAYQMLQEHPELLKITPIFYGPVRFESILDNDQGFPPATFLMADCAYQMEYIPVHFDKLGHHPLCAEITASFAKSGIKYLTDASIAVLPVTEGGNLAGIRVIDFSDHEYIA